MQISLSPGPKNDVIVSELSASQKVTLRGLEVVQGYPPVISILNDPAFLVRDCAGPVWLEDCTGTGNLDIVTLGGDSFAFGEDGLRAENSASVTAVRCSFTGGGSPVPFIETVQVGHGVQVDASSVSLYETTSEGGPANGPFACGAGTATAGHGVLVQSGFLFSSGCTFLGGEGFAAPGTDGANGGDGMRLGAGAPTVHTLDGTFSGASGAVGDGGCLDGFDGLATRVLAGSLSTFPGRSYSFAASSPVREGGTTIFHFEADPGDLLFLGLAATPGALFLPFLHGVVHYDLAIQPIFLGATPAPGSLDLPLVINPLSPGLEGARVFLQTVVLTTGFELYLTSPSALVLLDAAL